jgi:TonB family protein
VRPSIASLLCALLLGSSVSVEPQTAEGRNDEEGQSEPGRRTEPEWFVVNQAELRSIEGVPIGAVCFNGSPPKPVATRLLELPDTHPFRRGGGVVVVHTVINAKGLVVKAQILRGPETPELREAVVRCLREWRYEPARDRHGAPWAVHFMVTLAVPAPSSPGA